MPVIYNNQAFVNLNTEFKTNSETRTWYSKNIIRERHDD